MKARWLDRNLIESPIYYTLATSDAILRAELKRLKIPNDLVGVSKGFGATAHFLENDDGEMCAIVCLYEHKHERIQTYSLLVHEAVHIFQQIKKKMNEANPSDEFEAYSVQRISQSLMYEYERQRGGKKNGSKRTR